jgi:hypothetical protein
MALHETFERIFETNPAVPAKHINDDDFYVYDFTRRRLVEEYSCNCTMAQTIRTRGLEVKPGQGVFRGLQLKMAGLA